MSAYLYAISEKKSSGSGEDNVILRIYSGEPTMDRQKEMYRIHHIQDQNVVSAKQKMIQWLEHQLLRLKSMYGLTRFFCFFLF
jgi:hypothetical protein